MDRWVVGRSTGRLQKLLDRLVGWVVVVQAGRSAGRWIGRWNIRRECRECRECRAGR